jgi:polyisoprenoid-binding protein YceI
VLDPERTSIEMRLGATLHTVSGTFELVRGEVRFWDTTGIASGELVVDARSGSTGIGLRDRSMHEKVLESELYPLVVFRPRGLEAERLGDTYHVRLSGLLEMHGQSRPFVLPLQVRGSEDDVAIEGRVWIDYPRWGMKRAGNFVFRVADRVEIEVKARGAIHSRTGRDTSGGRYDSAPMNVSSASMCSRGVAKPGSGSPIRLEPVLIARIEKWLAPAASQAARSSCQRSGPTP